MPDAGGAVADVVARVRSLLALAADAGTPREEARTAAMQACALIVREKLLDVKPVIVEVPTTEAGAGSPRRWGDIGPRPRGRAVGRNEVDQIIEARAAGTCAVCRRAYEKGDRVVFQKREREFVHPECRSKRRGRAKAAASEPF